MKTQMRIKIKDFVGRAAIDEEDGQRLYEQIAPLIERDENVEMDFSGVDVFASPFFNWSLAILAQRFDSQKLNARLHIEGLSAEGRKVAKRSIDNAKEFRDPASRDRIADIIAQIADQG